MASKTVAGTPEANKQLVLEFNQKVFIEKNYDDKTLEKYIGENYIEHNPLSPDGREALKDLETILDGVEIKRSGADGDLVWVHVKFELAGQPSAAIDIYRVENHKIVEHWDVIQKLPVPGESKNAHPMF